MYSWKGLGCHKVTFFDWLIVSLFQVASRVVMHLQQCNTICYIWVPSKPGEQGETGKWRPDREKTGNDVKKNLQIGRKPELSLDVTSSSISSIRRSAPNDKQEIQSIMWLMLWLTRMGMVDSRPFHPWWQMKLHLTNLHSLIHVIYVALKTHQDGTDLVLSSLIFLGKTTIVIFS